MSRSWLASVRLASLALGTTLIASCGGGSNHGPVDAGIPLSPVLRAQVVAALATNVIYAEAQSFEASAAALDTALAAYAADPSSTTLRDAARTAWRATMNAWERMEVLQVGPSAYPAAAIGGLGIRDEIYSWPIVSRCGIDERVVDQSYAATATLAAAPINVRGLAAIEYLLFNPSTGNACGSLNAINANGSWGALADLDARRAAYASSAAMLVHAQATRLRAEWDPAGSNFLGTILAAGEAGNAYPTAQEALNGISNAFFYVDLVTKDMKVAIPAALTVTCTEPCPALVEAALSDASLDDIRANLAAYRLLFTGGPGDALGFDDLLVSVQRDDLATQMVADIDTAIAMLDALILRNEPLESLVLTDLPAVQALYTAIQDMTDFLKADLLTVLDLERPMGAATDND